MIKINKAIIVEGKYDKIKLSSLIDATIITTDGFKIFKDKEKMQLIKSLAQTVGIIVITDSDVAGFKIRNFIKSITKDENVTHVYIPQILGKEPRKNKASKEGTLGVEGIESELLKDILQKQNIEYSNDDGIKITPADFFRDGLNGGQNATTKRKALLKYLDLPEYMTTKALLSVINIFMSYDEYVEYIEKTNDI